MTVILLVLAGAYAWSAARSVQQEVSNQQLSDLSYFLTGARQSLRAGDPEIVAAELQRYSELYDTQIAVLDRSGAVWAAGGLRPGVVDDEMSTRISLALSGRRSDPVPATLPWAYGETTIVEPVIDDGNVIGAVLISENAEASRSQILQHWTVLVIVCLLIITLLILAVFWLAHWVLRPMRRVDRAMAAIEHGEMGARIADDTGPPEMRRMIALFNQMADEIERVMLRQQEFAMNASHELRNPLGALLMRVEYLATGLDESWADDIEKTREEGRRMSRILETLLSMARGERKDSAFVAVELVELAGSRAAAWRQVAREKRVRFQVQGEPPLLSLTDRTAVESALDVVIDNALKFAPRGTAIEITVAQDDEECVLAVRDHGPGLSEDEVEQVTGRFWRSPRDAQLPGSGLGLAIATDLLEALRGSVRVLVPDDGGLRVELRLPGGDAA